MENPVYYVQMAHARIAGIARKAAEVGVTRAPRDEVDLGLLTHERELDVLRSLSELPDTVAVACKDRAPHRVTTWVRELAGAFHGFYHDCYVIGEGVSPELTQARLWLVEASRIGLAIGLGLLGVAAPESMCSALPPHLLPDTSTVDRRRTPQRRRLRRRRPRRGARHAALRLRRGPPARPLPRGGRRVPEWRRVREQGVPLPGDGRPRARGGHAGRRRLRRRDARRPQRRRPARTARPARQQQERPRAPRKPAKPRSERSWSTASTSSSASAASTPRTASCPRVLVRVTPGVEAHTHEFVRTGQVDSKFGFGLASGDAATGRRPRRRQPGRRSRGRPHAHRQPGLRRRLLPPGDRRGGAVAARAGARGAVDRRRTRGRVRRGGGGAHHHRVGGERPRRLCRGRHHRPRHGRARARHRRRRGDHALLASARSRSCRASARTCRWTAA